MLIAAFETMPSLCNTIPHNRIHAHYYHKLCPELNAYLRQHEFLSHTQTFAHTHTHNITLAYQLVHLALETPPIPLQHRGDMVEVRRVLPSELAPVSRLARV